MAITYSAHMLNRRHKERNSMSDLNLTAVRQIVEAAVAPLEAKIDKTNKILVGNGEVEDSICFRVKQNEKTIAEYQTKQIIDKTEECHRFVQSFRKSPGWAWIVLSYLLTTGVVIYFNLQNLKHITTP